MQRPTSTLLESLSLVVLWLSVVDPPCPPLAGAGIAAVRWTAGTVAAGDSVCGVAADATVGIAAVAAVSGAAVAVVAAIVGQADGGGRRSPQTGRHYRLPRWCRRLRCRW